MAAVANSTLPTLKSEPPESAKRKRPPTDVGRPMSKTPATSS